MSGFEPMFMAGGAGIGTTTLATEVMGPTLFEGLTTAGAEFGVPSLFGGSSGLGALGGAAGELGGLGGLLGGGVSSAGTGLGAGALQGGFGSIAPEAFAQTTAALSNALPGASQIISPEIMSLRQQLANTAMPEITELGQVTSKELVPEMLNTANPLANSSSYYPQLGNQFPAYAAEPLTTSSYFPDLTTKIPAYATEPAIDAISNVAQYPLGSSAERQALFGNTEGAYGLQGYDNRFAPLENPSGGGIMDMLKNGLGSVGKFIDENPKTSAAAAGLGGYLLGQKKNAGVPGAEKYSGPLSRFHYNPSSYTPTIAQPPANPYRPVYTSYAHGGLADLGGYSDGGRMLKGPGDGMSDDIPATIAHKQPARLANEEFVVPADVVSHLGNGSSEAGAKQLYKMMDRVRQARTGNKKQGKQINPEKYLA